MGVIFLLFFRVCIFCSGIFQAVYFLSFFRVWLFCHFLRYAFSILANSNCALLSFSAGVFSVTFQGVHLLECALSGMFILHSYIFLGVQFPLTFSGVCISCHFPGCEFVIFKGVQLPSWHILGCIFSILAFSSVIFLSRVCNFQLGLLLFSVVYSFVSFLSVHFQSVIFQVVHFLFWHFPGCAFSASPFNSQQRVKHSETQLTEKST